MPEAPKPNTLAVSWFYGEYKKNALVLSPKYQRNAIWSIGQKCFLIDQPDLRLSDSSGLHKHQDRGTGERENDNL